MPNLSVLTFTIDLSVCPSVLHSVLFIPRNLARILSGEVDSSGSGWSPACLESTPWVHLPLAPQVSAQNLNLIMFPSRVNFP